MKVRRGIYFDADKGSGGEPAESSSSKNSPLNVSDQVEQAFQNLLSRSGSGSQLAEQLYRENFQLREDRRQLREEVNDLKRQLPDDSKVLIPKTDAAVLAEYQKLGTVEDLGKLQGELSEVRRSELIGQVARDLGYSPKVLSHLSKGLDIESADETVDGEKQKVYYVVQGDNRTSLSKYAEEAWSDFMPSLKAPESDIEGLESRRFVKQTPGKTGKKLSPVEQRLQDLRDQQTKARENLPV